MGLYIEDLEGTQIRLGIQVLVLKTNMKGFLWLTSHGFLGILCIALSRNKCLPDSPSKTCHHLVPACFSQLTCPPLTQTFPSCHMGCLVGLWGHHAHTGLVLAYLSVSSPEPLSHATSDIPQVCSLPTKNRVHPLVRLVTGFPGGSDSKESACNAGDPVWSLGWEDPIEKGMGTLSSILA